MSSAFFTRVERAAPIFSRINGLIRAGQMKWEDRPLWYDAYVLYPPFYEPVWDKKMPVVDVLDIHVETTQRDLHRL